MYSIISYPMRSRRADGGLTGWVEAGRIHRNVIEFQAGSKQVRIECDKPIVDSDRGVSSPCADREAVRNVRSGRFSVGQKIRERSRPAPIAAVAADVPRKVDAGCPAKLAAKQRRRGILSRLANFATDRSLRAALWSPRRLASSCTGVLKARGHVRVRRSPLFELPYDARIHPGRCEQGRRFHTLPPEIPPTAAGGAYRSGAPPIKYCVMGYCKFLSSHAARSASVRARFASPESGRNIGAHASRTMMVGSTFRLGRQPCDRFSGPMAGSVDCMALITATRRRAGSGLWVSRYRSRYCPIT